MLGIKEGEGDGEIKLSMSRGAWLLSLRTVCGRGEDGLSRVGAFVEGGIRSPMGTIDPRVRAMTSMTKPKRIAM